MSPEQRSKMIKSRLSGPSFLKKNPSPHGEVNVQAPSLRDGIFFPVSVSQPIWAESTWGWGGRVSSQKSPPAQLVFPKKTPSWGWGWGWVAAAFFAVLQPTVKKKENAARIAARIEFFITRSYVALFNFKFLIVLMNSKSRSAKPFC